MKGGTIVAVWDNQAGRILQLKYAPGATSPRLVPLKRASFILINDGSPQVSPLQRMCQAQGTHQILNKCAQWARIFRFSLPGLAFLPSQPLLLNCNLLLFLVLSLAFSWLMAFRYFHLVFTHICLYNKSSHPPCNHHGVLFPRRCNLQMGQTFLPYKSSSVAVGKHIQLSLAGFFRPHWPWCEIESRCCNGS